MFCLHIHLPIIVGAGAHQACTGSMFDSTAAMKRVARIALKGMAMNGGLIIARFLQ